MNKCQSLAKLILDLEFDGAHEYAKSVWCGDWDEKWGDNPKAPPADESAPIAMGPTADDMKSAANVD